MSVDYLTKDTLIPTNQNYCCMSLFVENNIIKYIKISGSFNTIEETQEEIQILKEPGHYNFVAEMGSWNAFDPLPNKRNLNDQLNKMMKKYLIGIHKKNYEYEQRKYTLIIQNINDNIKVKQTELSETKDEENINKINDQIKILIEKIEDYNNKLLIVNEKLSNIEIDTKYEASIIDDNFTQNVPIKYNGKVKRTDEKVKEQNWYCISFLPNDDNHSLVGIKVSGCFETEVLANEHSSKLREINDSFNILVGKLYEWCPFNPDPDSVEAGESEYLNIQLNETMKKKKENEEKAKMFHELKKTELIKKNLEASIKTKKETRNKSPDLTSGISDIDNQIQELEKKFKEYDIKEQQLSEKLNKTAMNSMAI